jgi:hypothetical protein
MVTVVIYVRYGENESVFACSSKDAVREAEEDIREEAAEEFEDSEAGQEGEQWHIEYYEVKIT